MDFTQFDNIHEDIFSLENIYHIVLSEGNKVATRKQLFSDGGIVHIEWKVDNTKQNIFRVIVLKSKAADFTIGIERRPKKTSWVFSCKDGKKNSFNEAESMYS